jgi:hypothetical protein
VASHAGIAATSEAIVSLLEHAMPSSEFVNLPVKPYATGDFASPMSEGVSVHLYGVDIDASRRNSPWRVGEDGRRRRGALPLELRYMVTAWGGEVLKQQRLLGWATRVLHDTPILPAGLLNHGGPDAATFGPDEQVELIWEAISRSDFSDLWEMAKTRRQPSATYLARTVEIESTVALEQAPEVQARDFGYGQRFDRAAEEVAPG